MSPRSSGVRSAVRLALVAAALAAAPAIAGEPARLFGGPLFGPCAPRTLFAWNGAGVARAPARAADDPLVSERPDFTNAPTTVGRGVAQLETGYLFTDIDGESHSHAAPNGLLRVGVLADWLELRLGGTEVWENGPDGPARGVEGVSVGAKFALAEQSGPLPELGFITTLILPTGADLAELDGPLPMAELVYGWDLSDTLRLDATSALLRNTDGDGAAVYTEFDQSFSFSVTHSDRLSSFAEYFVLIPTATDAAGAQHFADAGLSLLATPDVQFDLFAGAGLNDAADDFFVGAGLVLRRR